MNKFFKEKVLSLGIAILIILAAMLGTYLVTSSTIHSLSDNQSLLPTLPPINTAKPADFTDDELFLYSCIDAFDASNKEIMPLRTISGTVRMVAFEQNGVTLCYLLDEMSQKKPDTAARMLALLGLAPSYILGDAVIFDIDASGVFRPAYSTDCTVDFMSVTQCELTEAQRTFINKLIVTAADKQLAFTRLGYSYDRAGSEAYGLSQFAADPADGQIVERLTLEELLSSFN